MKNTIFRGLLVTAAVLVLAACPNGGEQNRLPHGNYEAVTETGRIYQHLTDLDIERTIASIDLLFKYEPDLVNEMSARGYSEPWTFHEFFSLDGMVNKSLEDQLDLLDKLGSVDAAFNDAVESYAAALDYSFFDSLPGYKVVEDEGLGTIVIEDGDILINPNGMQGLFELLLRKDREEGNLNATINDMKTARTR